MLTCIAGEGGILGRVAHSEAVIAQWRAAVQRPLA
jgi:hypothetical protein